MQTECPHCNTVFRILKSELEKADGQVRCGHCLAIFSANNPYSAFKRTEENPSFETNNTETIDTDFIAIDEPTAQESESFVADVIPPELRAETREKNTRYGFIGSLILGLLILTSIAGLVLQYAYYNRDTLAKNADFRPWLTLMCQQARCTIPPPKDRKKIALSSKNIYSHPNEKNALMISASIVNQANFSQDYPIIELRFENVRGETIAGRRFTAVEYLNIPEDQIAKMQPDTPINISLEIKDPGKDMVSYEFAFL